MFNFGVSPPWYRNDPAEWVAFNLYAMEQEGYFDEEEEDNNDETN